MGIVYFGFDHQEQRPVALKTFKPEYLPNPDARARFLRTRKRITSRFVSGPLYTCCGWWYDKR